MTAPETPTPAVQKALPKDAWPWLLTLAVPFAAALLQRALTVGLDGRVDQLPLLLCAAVPLVGGALVALAARPSSTLRTQLPALPVPLHLAAWLLTALAIGNLGAKVAFTPTLALGAGLVGAVLWALAGQAFITQDTRGLGLLTLGGFVLLLGRLSKSTEFAAWCWYVGLPLAALGLYWLTGPSPTQAATAPAEASKKKKPATAGKARSLGSQEVAPYGLDVLGPLGVLGVVVAVAIKNVRNDETSSLLQLGIASAALGVLAWGYRLTTQGRPLAFARLRDRLLLALGIAGAAGYCNFFHLHFNNFLHIWDTYHYYMGAKYFPELKYDRLYDCAVVADSEDGLREKLEKRTITDLRTNIIVKANTALEHPEACKGEFSAARWEAFKKDIRFFRGRVNDGRWEEIHHDHGFNATPVWILLGYLVTNATVADTNQVTALNLIDPVYLLLTALMLYWAFGPRVMAIGLIVVGTNWPSRFFYWTGGALLRHDWLFYTVAVICLLKKNKPGLAGAALAYAALLRLFPGLMLFGPLLAGAELWRRVRAPAVEGEDRAERDAAKVHLKAFWRFIAGGALATALLIGASVPIAGGLETWQRFAQNTAKHARTPLTNHMGLRTIASWRPWTNGAQLRGRDGDPLDSWALWKNTRVAMWHQAQPVFALLCLGAAALVYLALRQQKSALWPAAAMGVGFITVGAELTNYYYVFFMGFAALHALRREVGMVLMGTVIISIFTMLTPIAGMSGWQDEQSVLMSVYSLAATVGLWWLFTRWGEATTLEPEAAPKL